LLRPGFVFALSLTLAADPLTADSRHTYCAPHYFGGGVVAANNLGDRLPGNNEFWRGCRGPRE